MRTIFTTILQAFFFFIVLQPNPLRAQTWQWVSVNTAPASTNIHSGCTASAIDAAGNTVMAGFFKGVITFGSVSLTSTSPGSFDDLFVVRVTPAGVCTQATLISGNNSTVHINALAVDANNNVVIGGDVSGTFILGPGLVLNTSPVSFVARMNSAGTWTQLVAGGIASSIKALVLDAQGNAVVTGYFSSATSIFGATRLSGSNLYHTLFVARLSTTGTWTQAVQTTGTGDSDGTGVVLDSNGSTVVLGTFEGTPVSFGTTTLINAGGASGNTGTDIVVARLSSTGTWTQAVSAGGADDDTANALAVDASGTAVVGGVVQNNGRFGTISPLQTYRGGYVARLSRTGVWQQAVARNLVTPQRLVLDAQGNVLLSGLENFGFGVVYRVTSAGLWSALAGIGTGGNAHNVGGLTLDNSGGVVVVGQLGGIASFGTLDVNPNGRFMYFAARLTGGVLTAVNMAKTVSLGLFPQPAHGVVTLEGFVGALKIRDIQGREVRQYQTTASQKQLNLAGLPAGLYIVQAGGMVSRLLIE
jgi:hypothetical protein